MSDKRDILILAPLDLIIDYYGSPFDDGYDISAFPILPAGCEYRIIRALYNEHKYIGLESFFIFATEQEMADMMVEKARRWMHTIVNGSHKPDKGIKFLEDISSCHCPSCGMPNKLDVKMRGTANSKITSFDYDMACACGYKTVLQGYIWRPGESI